MDEIKTVKSNLTINEHQTRQVYELRFKSVAMGLSKQTKSEMMAIMMMVTGELMIARSRNCILVRESHQFEY